MATINIPTPLRKFTDSKAQIMTTGDSVGEAITELAELHPELRKHLFQQCGKLQSYILVYLGKRDIKALQNEETPLEEKDKITIISAIAGG